MLIDLNDIANFSNDIITRIEEKNRMGWLKEEKDYIEANKKNSALCLFLIDMFISSNNKLGIYRCKLGLQQCLNNIWRIEDEKEKDKEYIAQFSDSNNEDIVYISKKKEDAFIRKLIKARNKELADRIVSRTIISGIREEYEIYRKYYETRGETAESARLKAAKDLSNRYSFLNITPEQMMIFMAGSDADIQQMKRLLNAHYGSFIEAKQKTKLPSSISYQLFERFSKADRTSVKILDNYINTLSNKIVDNILSGKNRLDILGNIDKKEYLTNRSINKTNFMFLVKKNKDGTFEITPEAELYLKRYSPLISNIIGVDIEGHKFLDKVTELDDQLDAKEQTPYIGVSLTSDDIIAKSRYMGISKEELEALYNRFSNPSQAMDLTNMEEMIVSRDVAREINLLYKTEEKAITNIRYVLNTAIEKNKKGEIVYGEDTYFVRLAMTSKNAVLIKKLTSSASDTEVNDLMKDIYNKPLGTLKEKHYGFAPNVCRKCKELHGTIYSIRDLADKPWLIPPSHPRCRCILKPIRDPKGILAISKIFNKLNPPGTRKDIKDKIKKMISKTRIEDMNDNFISAVVGIYAKDMNQEEAVGNLSKPWIIAGLLSLGIGLGALYLLTKGAGTKIKPKAPKIKDILSDSFMSEIATNIDYTQAPEKTIFDNNINKIKTRIKNLLKGILEIDDTEANALVEDIDDAFIQAINQNIDRIKRNKENIRTYEDIKRIIKDEEKLFNLFNFLRIERIYEMAALEDIADRGNIRNFKVSKLSTEIKNIEMENNILNEVTKNFAIDENNFFESVLGHLGRIDYDNVSNAIINRIKNIENPRDRLNEIRKYVLNHIGRYKHLSREDKLISDIIKDLEYLENLLNVKSYKRIKEENTSLIISNLIFDINNRIDRLLNFYNNESVNNNKYIYVARRMLYDLESDYEYGMGNPDLDNMKSVIVDILFSNEQDYKRDFMLIKSLRDRLDRLMTKLENLLLEKDV